MRFWFEFFKDKRFAWDFKIANFIMRDYLRNYLATDCLVLEEVAKSNNCPNFHKKRINKVIKNLNRLMEG